MVRKSNSPSKGKKEQQEPADNPVVESRQQTLASETKKETKQMSEASIIEYASDLNDAEAPVPLPVGDYPATIRAAERKTSAKGNDYINVTFHIDPESYPADFTEGDPDGTTLSFGRLSPEDTTKARWGMKKFLTAVGAPLGKALDLNDLVGLSATVQIKHDEYEGMPQAQIAKVKEA